MAGSRSEWKIAKVFCCIGTVPEESKTNVGERETEENFSSAISENSLDEIMDHADKSSDIEDNESKRAYSGDFVIMASSVPFSFRYIYDF